LCNKRCISSSFVGKLEEESILSLFFHVDERAE
jgi:hypothetical protein